MSLKNKTILVTGAAGLLGKKTVKMLLAEQAKVIATDINEDVFKQQFSAIFNDNAQSQLSFKTLDLLNERQVKVFFSQMDSVDGAVNCSYPRNKFYGAHFLDVTLENFNDNVGQSLGASFLLTQQCAAYFKRMNKPFSLVNISSIYGVVAPDFSIYQGTEMTMPIEYAAIKSALLHLNKYAVNYINNSLFRVNSVSPGGLFDHQPEAFLAAYKDKTHGKGMLDAEQITGAIKFLLSDESQYITGQNIVIDDGFSL